MPAPTTTAEFLDLVQKSGVLDDKKFEAYLEKQRAANALPSRPGEVAALFVRDGLLTQFQAEQFLQGRWRRFTIGKYKVLERLGSGGMGSVYLCEHKLMRRRVAVKVLPTAKAEDPSALERFYREARAVAALDHPNIVRAYDIDQDEKLHFLVMEYVDGASLQEIVKRTGPLDPLRSAHYIRQAAMGLQHAHEAAGLVHRDIKPGNILVDRNGTVKVLDMGLARFFHDEEDVLTKKYDENVLGTADYLPPEQAIDSHTVDIRADIYSLGATFYFCLTGRTPFAEGTVAQKLIWHQTRQPKPIRSLRPEVPEGLVAVIDKMMAKDPNQRYQTPLEVVEALAPWTQTPIEPPRDAEMPQLSPAAMGGSSDAAMSGPTPVSLSGPASPSPRASWQPSAPRSPRPRSNPPAAPTATTAAPTVRPVPPRPPSPAPTPAITAPPLVPARNGQPAPVPAITAAEDEQVAAWDELDTETPTGRADTAPASGQRGSLSSRSMTVRKIAEDRARQSSWWILVLIGLGFLAVLGVGLGAAAKLGVFGKFEGPVREATQPQLPEVVYVGHAGTAYRSIGQALPRVRSGGRVVLLEDIEEQVILSKGTPRGVTIEPATGKMVVLRAPAFIPADDAILKVDTVEGVHIRDLTFDGGNRLKKLILLSGQCPDLTLENLHLQNFNTSAVQVMNCAGTPERPVVLSKLQANTSQKAEAALLFDLNPRYEAVPVNQHIRIRGCRFEGPLQNAIVNKATPLVDVTCDNTVFVAPGKPETTVTLPH